MTTSPEPGKQEHPSTYVVRDRSSELELLRLEGQDRLFTEGMGGLLSEQADPNSLRSILDVACGPGWWLIETAKTYPAVSRLVGLDVSSHMVTYANQQAEAAGVGERVRFQTGDALRLLEFPDNSFQLVNQRLAMSFLRKWDWPKLLNEYHRVCAIDGIIRITESSFAQTSSPALNRLFDLLLQSFWNAGFLFTEERDGVIRHLGDKMQQYGIANVQTKTHAISYTSANPESLAEFVKDMQRGFKVSTPFIQKWTKVPSDYEDIYEQMVLETQQPDFQASITLLTAWGVRS